MNPGKKSENTKQQRAELMARVIWAVPPIYHRLTGFGEIIYTRHALTAGKRSLLNDLAMKGPHTIAQMVQVRPPISRQYIQRLISELRRSGMVELTPNPDDRRSKTVHLTDEGRRVIDALTPVEQSLAHYLAANHSAPELEAAGNVLQNILKLLDTTDAWPGNLVDGANPGG